MGVRWSRRMAGAGLLAAVVGWAGSEGIAGTGDLPRALKPGKLLVASRRLLDPNFSETVVLLLDYGPGGALGVIINRPSDVRVRTVLSHIAELRERDDPIFLGGPVARNRMLLLVRARRRPAEATKVLDEVYVGPSLDALRKHLRKSRKSSFRAYAGHAGWAPGQLEAEVRSGSWYIAPASADIIFQADPAKIWPTLIERVEDQSIAELGARGNGPRSATPATRCSTLNRARSEVPSAVDELLGAGGPSQVQCRRAEPRVPARWRAGEI